MEINVKVMIDASERLCGAIGSLLGNASPVEPEKKLRVQMNADAQAAQPEPVAEQAAAAPAVPAPAPVAEPTPEPEPEPEPAAPAAAPIPEDELPPIPKEKPEDVLPLLRQRFGIPDNKDDRDDEQQLRAKNLSKAVLALIRDITKNPKARSVADLRTDEDRFEFVRCALLISIDLNTGTFQVNPF